MDPLGPKHVELKPEWSMKTYSVKSHCVSRWTIYIKQGLSRIVQTPANEHGIIAAVKWKTCWFSCNNHWYLGRPKLRVLWSNSWPSIWSILLSVEHTLYTDGRPPHPTLHITTKRPVWSFGNLCHFIEFFKRWISLYGNCTRISFHFVCTSAVHF